MSDAEVLEICSIDKMFIIILLFNSFFILFIYLCWYALHRVGFFLCLLILSMVGISLCQLAFSIGTFNEKSVHKCCVKKKQLLKIFGSLTDAVPLKILFGLLTVL